MSTFSIILPTYNRAKLLPRAIQSIIEQSNEDWEVILVDDGSTDNTKELITQYNESRIHYVHQENRGRSSARNHGLEKATGDWICFLDSDDWFDVNHLETFQKAIKDNPEETVFKTGVTFMDENAKTIFQSKFKTEKEGSLQYISQNYCGILDVCISRKKLENIEFEDISTWEDKAFLLDVLKSNSIYQIPKRTVNALEHSDRSVLKVYENPGEINSVFQVMEKKLKNCGASVRLVSKVRQNFLLSILIDAKEAKFPIHSLLSTLDIKPSLTTRLKLIKASLFRN